jgi:lipoprotein-releasing system permease protein
LTKHLITGNLRILNTEFFIAKRIIGRRDGKKKISSPTIRIAIGGVAIGLAVMILTVSIVRGFQFSIRDKVEGFNADIQINNFDNNNSYEPVPVIKEQSFLPAVQRMPGVKHIQVYATKIGIIKTKTDNEGVLLKGISGDYDWSFVKKNLVRGSLFLPHDTIPLNDIVISKTIANELGVDTGSHLLIFFITKTKTRDAYGHYSYEQRVKTFNVKGIYSSGLEEFDKQFVFVDIGQIQKLNFWTSSQVGGFEILCNNFNDVDKVEDSVNNVIGQNLNAESIKKINSAIFSWLQLQNTNAAIIIILMAIVSAIAMISALIVLILENTNMIGLLKALGSRNVSIQQIFLIDGAYLILWGLFWGNLIGLTLCYLQSHYGLIKLDQETYYVSQVPIYLNWKYVLVLNGGAFFSCMVMLILPSFIISRILPVRTLKYS